MMKIFFVQPVAAQGVRPALSCVWIETGNPRQPLACVWIDLELRAFRGDEPAADEDPVEFPPVRLTGYAAL